MDLDRRLSVAVLAAKAGGAVLKEYFETSIDHEEKEDRTFVTEADKKSEEVIRGILNREFPDDDILGEESGHEDRKSEYLWVIDPLDGTANFMNAIPIFAVSLALMKGEDTLVAAVYNPVTDSLFSATKGGGAFWNEKAVRVSGETTKNVIVTFGKSSKKEDAAGVNALFVAYQAYGFRVRHLGSAALELAYLARGGTEGFVNLGTKLWDYAGGALLVLEAGGKLTDLAGRPWTPSERFFVASNGKIHATLLEETTKLKQISRT